MIRNIKALAADIDMTLTFKGADLPPLVAQAFTLLHEQGVKLGLATGREITDKLKHQGKTWGLPFEFDFIIGMNGGMVYDSEDGTMWCTELLTTDEMKAILEYMMPLIDKYEISVNAEGGGNHNAMYIRGELLASARRHGFDFVDKTGDIDGFCERPAYKFLFRSTPENEAEIRQTFLERFGGDYQIIGTFPGTVEAMRKGIDKGSGMKRYADKRGISMGNIIAFGDNENDNSLLTACGWGVALKNATDATKAIADDVTEYDCENSGVGHYLFDHYL
ncbi:MAG: HAD family hydrolase [Solobacterium sp.]|nr:HAD family hydrolase [Solobacterium sp.]